MNVINRNIISKNFTYVESDKKYYIEDLYNNIDYWKYVLKKVCKVSSGETVGFGITAIDLDYFGLIFASLELSLQLVILDYSYGADKNNIEDFKTDVYGKIDTFIYYNNEVIDKNKKYKQLFNQKIQYYISKSKKHFNIRDLTNIRIKENIYKDIMPLPSDIMLFCTSSGTTGTPKIVKHNHEFMYNLVMRNKKIFKGSVLHLKNLHHGSSLAVFFLPTLASDAVSFHASHSLNSQKVEEVAKIAEDLKIENTMFPFTYDIENFLLQSTGRNYNNLKIFTLSYISPNWKEYLKLGIEKFESIFGSNETSGPLFISVLNNQTKEFNPSEFQLVDDFYSFNFVPDLEVSMPIYGTKIKTNDNYTEYNNKFYHHGRKDIIKINQVILNLQDVNEITNRIDSNIEIIADTVYNKIYLAIWAKRKNNQKIKKIEAELKKIDSTLNVDAVEVLDKATFYRGIKLDKELVRSYFRKARKI